MAVATLSTMTVGANTFTIVDNDSTRDYQECFNPRRYSITKNGNTLLKKYPSIKMAFSHFGGIILKSAEQQSIAAQPRRIPGL